MYRYEDSFIGCICHPDANSAGTSPETCIVKSHVTIPSHQNRIYRIEIPSLPSPLSPTPTHLNLILITQPRPPIPRHHRPHRQHILKLRLAIILFVARLARRRRSGGAAWFLRAETVGWGCCGGGFGGLDEDGGGGCDGEGGGGGGWGYGCGG